MNEIKVENKMKYEVLKNNYKRPVINRSESLMKKYDLGVSSIDPMPPITAETCFSTQSSALFKVMPEQKHQTRTRYQNTQATINLTDMPIQRKKIKVEISKSPKMEITSPKQNVATTIKTKPSR